MTRRTLLADRRAAIAAELHQLDSWRARIAHVRDIAGRMGIDVQDTGVFFRCRLLGRERISSKSADASVSGWALSVMREFPEPRP